MSSLAKLPTISRARSDDPMQRIDSCVSFTRSLQEERIRCMAESWKKKIFVVDDDPMFIMSIKGLITGAGYDVDTAMTGKDALEKLGKGMPDLIIIDVIMKDMNGFELTRAIRGVDKKVPIIILTGMRAESDKFE